MSVCWLFTFRTQLYTVCLPSAFGVEPNKRLDLDPKKGVYGLVTDAISGEVNLSQIETFMSVLDPKLTV